jgi:pyruvate,water dikinase
MVAPVAPEITAFPIVWEDPADSAYTYMFDAMHFPRPVSPLFGSMLSPAFERGFTQAMRELDAPLLGAKTTIQNGYYFNAFVPMPLASEEEARALGERAEATVRRELPRLRERWNVEHFPAVAANNARVEAMAPATAERSAVPALIDELLELGASNWTIHFRIVVPMLIAMQLFDELYAELFAAADGDSHALLTGIESQSVKAGYGLSDLAKAAKAAGLADVMLSHPAEQVMAALEAAPNGAYLGAAIRDYLREYGLRQDLFEYSVPTWIEEPSIAIASIQSYLRTGHDARAEHDAAAARASEALAQANQRLTVYPEAVRGQFAAMLEAARAANFLQEEHNFYIDQRSIALGRLFFVELGKRLVAEGVLEGAEAIFMLTLDELKALFATPAAEVDGPAVRALVARRTAEQARFATLTPPPFVGQPPAGPPPSHSPVDRGMVRFFGGPPQEAGAPNQIKGNAGSRGTARGVARVARTLEEAKSIEPGEILVTITTMPAWTPLFGTAAAVVTETGGALSHCAIVAREYGIPAVVGAFGATNRIQTGQTISVDGATGVITLED